MAIKMLGAAPPVTGQATEEEVPQELTFSQKLKAVADKPTRELSLAERIAVSAPGRAILGTVVGVGEHPVSRGIASAPVNAAAAASDLYMGATQKTYEVAGMEDAAKDVQDARLKVRGVVDEVDNFNAQQDKLYGGGETMARVLRGASSSITEALTAGGVAGMFGNASKGNSLLMQYYATRSTQEALRKAPDQWDTAIAHGLIDGISTGLGEYIGLPTAALAGVPKTATNKLLARTMARVKDRIPLPEAAMRSVFGTGLEAGTEVMTETAHYFADVSAGLEKLDWAKYGKRMAETAATAGLTGAAATGVQNVVDTLQKRHESIGGLLDGEAATKNRDLFAQEVEAGLVELPAEEEAAAPAPPVIPMGDQPLEADELNLLEQYVGSAEKVNKDIRSGQPGKSTETISRAIQKMPKYTGTTWRGLNFKDVGAQQEFLSKIKVGGTFADPAFMSTSVSKKKAGEFVGAAENDLESFMSGLKSKPPTKKDFDKVEPTKPNTNGVMLQVKGESGRTLVNDDESKSIGMAGELEVLFDRDTQFRVDAVDTDADGLTTVTVSEIPTAAPAPATKSPKPTAEEAKAKRADQVALFYAANVESFNDKTIEQRLFDLAMREQKLQSVNRAAERLQAASKHQPGRQVVDTGETTGPQQPADAAKLYEKVASISNSQPIAATEAINAVPTTNPAVDAELALLAEMEAEANKLRRNLMDDGNVQSPRREQLMQDLEDHNAAIAERLSQLTEEDSPTPPEIQTAAGHNILPQSRAQRRVAALTRQVGEAKAKTRAVASNFRQRRQLDQQMIADSLAYVRQALPPSQRFGLEAAAAKVNTVGKLGKFIQRVDQTIAKYDKKVAKHGLAAAMKKAQKYATAPEDRAKVEDVLSAVDVSPSRVRAQATALVDYVKAHPEVGTPAGYQQALEKANKIGVNELTADEIRQLSEAVESVAASAATDNQFRTIARDQTIDQYADTVKAQIAVNRPRASSATGEQLAKVANMVYRPETIMAGLSENLRVLAWENIGVEAQRKQIDYAQQQHDDMVQQLNQRGLSPDRVVGQTFQGGSALNAWRYEARSVGGQNLTRSEAMHLYGLMLDPEAANILREGGAILAKNKLRKKPTQLAINDGTLREIGEFLGAEGREIVEHGFARMNSVMRDAVNGQWVSTYNRPLSERNNYFPIRRDQDWAMDTKSPETFMRDLGDAALDGYGEFGVTKRREAATLSPLEVGDFFDVYTRHIDTTSRIASYMAPVRDFASVYGRSDVKQAIVNASSEATYKGVLEAVKQQVLPVRDPDDFSRAARKLVHGSGAAVLGLRVVTPYKNSIGLVVGQSLYQGGEKMLASAVAQASDPSELQRMEGVLQANSPVWRQRTGHYLHEATGGMAGESRSFQPSSIPDVTLAHVATADKFTGLVRGFMVENYVQNTLGIRPDAPNFATEVAKEWERLLYRTESTSHGMEMSGALRAGRRHGVVGSLVQFGSGSSKTLSLLQAARNDVGQGQYKRGVRKMAAFGSAVLTDAIIGAFFAAAAIGEEEELIDRTIGSMVRMAPMVGDALNQAYRKARGKKVFSGSSDSLTDMVGGGIMSTADLYLATESYLSGGLTDEGDPEYQQHAKNAADRLSLLLGSVTKLPTEGAKDIAKRFANGLGVEGSEKEELAAAVRRLTAPTDIGEPRNKLKAALKANDDALFIQGLEEVYAANPERFTTETLNGIVEGQFAAVARIENNPELVMNMTDSELAAMRYLVDQRTALRRTLQDMVSRNLGQIKEIAKSPRGALAGTQ